MKCQTIFSRKNKKNITTLLSAESAHGVVNFKHCDETKQKGQWRFETRLQ